MSPESDVLLHMYAKAPSPIRDYYGITITNDHVTLNIWNISHGPHVFPKKYKTHVSEYLEDKELQYQIENAFGTHVRDFVMSLAQKQYNLQHMPTKVFLKILNFLASRDILHLSQTSKVFFQLCNTESVWRMICCKELKRRPTKQEQAKAEDVGWKQVVKDKITQQKKAKSKAAVLNNSNNRKMGDERSACKIEFIRNVRPNVVPNNVKKTEQAKNNSRTVPGRIERKNERNTAVQITNTKKTVVDVIKNVDKKRNDEKGDYRGGFIRNVRSAVMLENKKNVEEPKKMEADRRIRSVTDIINTVTTARIKSSSNTCIAKNKTELRKNRNK